MVKVVGSGSREHVVVLEAAMMSEIRGEVTGEKAVSGWVGRGRVTEGGGGAEGSEIKAAREVLILEILLVKVRRKELQRSVEEGGLVSGGWRRFLTVEKRLRGL